MTATDKKLFKKSIVEAACQKNDIITYLLWMY